jgi:hypothetical protein
MEWRQLVPESFLFVYNSHSTNISIFDNPIPDAIFSIVRASLYSESHSQVAPENVGLQKEQKCISMSYL